jgi:CRAL/TRIO domain
MELTEEETRWAWAIKEALDQDDSELASTITDFEIAHHAIIAKSKIEKGLKRIHRLDKFRKEHGIPPTREMEAQDAVQMIQRFEALCPGMVLAFNKEATQDFYVSTYQYSAFLPDAIKTPEDWKTTFAAFYYIVDAHHPNIEAMRAGMVMITEVKGMGWKNFSLEMEKHAAKLYQDAYPVRIKAMVMLNAPKIFQVMVCRNLL